MRFTFTLIIFLFVSSLGLAQTVLFHDTFQDDKNKWTLSQNNITSYIKNDKLVIENSDNEKTKWLLNDVFTDTGEIDFDIETTITVLESSKDNFSYGLVWSCYNDYNYYDVVQLTPDKQNQVYQYQKGSFKYQKNWTKNSKINGYKKENTIKIEKRANVVKIYINNDLILQSGKYNYFGYKIGYILDAKMKIEIDELKVTSYPKKIKVVETFSKDIKLNSLPDYISTKDYDELNPVVSADGKILYTTRIHPNNVGDNTKYDIWISEKNASGQWGELVNIGKPLNNSGSNFVISTSPDNNTILLANTYNPDGSSKSDGLSITSKGLAGWNVPTNIVIKDFKNVNKSVSFFMTTDNRVLLLAVENEKSFGLKDIFVSFVNADGTWSSPINIGKTVNTFEDEANPFLAADGKTMYFASEGHGGYGYDDLYVTKRLDDSWTNWSEPKNLGNVINSPQSDLFYFVTAKGDKAYISKNGDIFELDNTVKQDPVVLVKGKVYDAKTKQVVSAKIEYNNLKTNKIIGTAISDPKTGSYSIVLPYGSNYSFMADKENYYATTQNVDLSNLKEYKEMEVDLYLTPIEKGAVIRLNNIFFDSGKYTLLAESFAELDILFGLLNDNKNIKIEIAGHTDAVGSDVDNLTLSNNRANAVVNYLLGKGIAKDRLSAKGYGETKFIATNDTDEGKQLNRRVEFVILEK